MTTSSTESPVVQFAVEQAKALALELEAVANRAPDGHVLHSIEGLLLTKGRELLRQLLEVTAQQQAEQVEKRGRRPGPVLVDTPVATRVAPRSRP